MSAPAASTMPLKTPPILLDYGLGALRRRRRIRRVRLLVGIVLVGWFAAHRWGEPVWRQSQEVYWQHECMTYQPPVDKIVFDEAGGEDSPLLKDGDQYRGNLRKEYNYYYEPPNPPVIGKIAELVPKAWTKFMNLNPIPITQVGQFIWWQSWPVYDYGAVIFMHELRAKSGLRYLVLADVSTGPYLPRDSGVWSMEPFYPDFRVDFFVFRPGGWRSPPVLVGIGEASWAKAPAWSRPRARLRIYAGQIDQHDPGHFTVPIEYEGQRDIVDGSLDDQLTPQAQAWGKRFDLILDCRGGVPPPVDDDVP